MTMAMDDGDGDGDGGARLPTPYTSRRYLHLTTATPPSYSTPELEIIIVVENILRYLYIYQ